MKVSPRCWVELDLEALRHNVSALRARLGESVRFLAVVKANAYGHGTARVVKALEGVVEMLGVADVAEALELNALVPSARILLFSPALPSERSVIVRNGFVPTISSVEEAEEYGRLHAQWREALDDEISAHEPLLVHLAVDTGMGRIGVWYEELGETIQDLLKVKGVMIDGISTHLPVADEDDQFTGRQLEHFQRSLDRMREAGLRLPKVHVLNSAGAIRFPKKAHDMARIGLALYGSAAGDFQASLKPVMTWKSRVSLVRDVGPGRGISYGRTFITSRPMRVATLAFGYADGYPRHLSGKDADVLIRGRRCAVLGRVTMDQIMVDVTALEEVQPGDEVVIMGRQGDEVILAAELAEKAGTIPWEIFTGVGSRVARL